MKISAHKVYRVQRYVRWKSSLATLLIRMARLAEQPRVFYLGHLRGARGHEKVNLLSRGAWDGQDLSQPPTVRLWKSLFTSFANPTSNTGAVMQVSETKQKISKSEFDIYGI